ncbi:MAG: hypothetical protein AAF612_04795 [Planctomycetota bacterium]
MPPSPAALSELARASRRSPAVWRRRALAALPKPVGAVVFDFDGVFTDNGVMVREDGVESAYCSRFDGMGVTLLRKAGVPILILSKEPNPVVGARAKKLGVPCLQGIDDKVPVLRDWLAERSIEASSCIYLGNDVNDAGPLAMVGCPVVVADAHRSVVPLARIVLTQAGGKGAVRELCDLVLDARGKG